MNIKTIKSFIAYNLVFLGLNSLFIKMDNIMALKISVITYFINLIFELFENKKRVWQIRIMTNWNIFMS